MAEKRERERERERERGAVSSGELPDRTIGRGSVPFVYFNSSLLVFLVFLTFLLSSFFCKVSHLVVYFVLHPLICSLLFWVVSKRSSDFVKESVSPTRLRAERKTETGGRN